MTEKDFTRQQSRNGNRRTQEYSTGSRPQQTELLHASAAAMRTLRPSLERLCSMKRVVSLTDHQCETWLAVLSVFPESVVNAAILEIGLSEDPFPDLGKLVINCERRRRTEAGTMPQDGVKRLGSGMVKAVAAALQLKID